MDRLHVPFKPPRTVSTCPNCDKKLTDAPRGFTQEWRRFANSLCRLHLQAYLESCQRVAKKSTLEQWAVYFQEMLGDRVDYLQKRLDYGVETDEALSDDSLAKKGEVAVDPGWTPEQAVDDFRKKAAKKGYTVEEEAEE
jgi:hypothetical protein